MSESPRPLFGRFGPLMTPDRIAFAGIFVVTGLGLLTIGATLPVLPKYVTGPIGGGDVAVGVVTGAFAATGLLFRPIGGAFADARGRKPVVVAGALLTALSGLLLFIPAGVAGLVVTRLFLGAGEGMVYTAGAAWIVDMAPVERRGRIIGLYGARDLGRPLARAADRRADPAGEQLRDGLGVRRDRAADRRPDRDADPGGVRARRRRRADQPRRTGREP